MQKKTKERRFIVVDDEDRPMSFQEPQFCYVPRKPKRGKIAYLETYTEAEAERLIEKSKKWTIKNNASDINYFLIPVKS